MFSVVIVSCYGFIRNGCLKAWGIELGTSKPVIAEYVRRVCLIREIVSGDSQRDFAVKIGIDMKRWNNFERGFPVPRDVAFILVEKLPGMSVDWLWFGWEKNLSPEWRRKIKAAERRRPAGEKPDKSEDQRLRR